MRLRLIGTWIANCNWTMTVHLQSSTTYPTNPEFYKVDSPKREFYFILHRRRRNFPLDSRQEKHLRIMASAAASYPASSSQLMSTTSIVGCPARNSSRMLQLAVKKSCVAEGWLFTNFNAKCLHVGVSTSATNLATFKALISVVELIISNRSRA